MKKGDIIEFGTGKNETYKIGKVMVSNTFKYNTDTTDKIHEPVSLNKLLGMTRPIKPTPKPFDPEAYAASGSETAHQIALFGWAHLERDKYPELRWMFHVPNGGARTKSGAGKLRAMGVKPDVPDICLPVRRGKYAMLWIELKREKKINKDGKVIKTAGRASHGQEAWLNHFAENCGCACMVAYGFHHARNNIIQYLEWDGVE